MPRAPRILLPNAIYHVFTRGVEKRDIFLDDQDRRAWLDLMLEARERFGCRYLAYCLMPNHVHLAVHTPSANLDELMDLIKGRYGQYFNQRYGRVGHLFQGRYGCRIVEKEKYLLNLVRYIHFNPVKDGFVDSIRNYRWSSRHHYAGETSDSLVSSDELFSLLNWNPEAGREILLSLEKLPLPQSDLRRLDSHRGAFLGDRNVILSGTGQN